MAQEGEAEAGEVRRRSELERRGGGRSWSEARRRPERSELELVRRRRAGARGGAAWNRRGGVGRGVFETFRRERIQDCGLISLKFEGFFAKHPENARSGPSVRPIGRPRRGRDVARSQARELARNRKEEISMIL